MQHIIVSTADLRPSEKFDYWNFLVQDHYNASQLATSQVMDATISSFAVEDIVLSVSNYKGHHGVRYASDISRRGKSKYYVQLVTKGHIFGSLENSEVLINAGDIYITDILQNSSMTGSEGATLTVVLDQYVLHQITGRQNFHGAIIRGGTPKARILTILLTEVLSSLENGQYEQASCLRSSIISMIACCFTPNHPKDDCNIKRRILNFIEDNINNVGLNVEVITEELNISRASLYRSFVSEGGVASFIRELRLTNALRELQYIRGKKNIKSLSHSFGFKSPVQFSASFRSRFGVSPSEVTSYLVNDVGSNCTSDTSDDIMKLTGHH